jgi:hypothetical protein
VGQGQGVCTHAGYVQQCRVSLCSRSEPPSLCICPWPVAHQLLLLTDRGGLKPTLPQPKSYRRTTGEVPACCAADRAWRPEPGWGLAGALCCACAHWRCAPQGASASGMHGLTPARTSCTCGAGLVKLGRTYIWPDGGSAGDTHAWTEHMQLRVCHGLAQGLPHCRRSARPTS